MDFGQALANRRDQRTFGIFHQHPLQEPPGTVGVLEGLGTGAQGGPGGAHIVHQQDPPAADGAFIGAAEGPADVPPSLRSGQVHLLGRPLDPDDPWFKRQTGVVAEQPALFSRLRGQEQLMLSARLFGLPADEAARRTRQLLQLVGLEADARTLVADYSRGMRKKLAMACALVHAPRLLFLDEPFEGVDALSSQTLRRVLGALCGRGATVLLTTHILEVAEKLCQRVGIIAAGRLVAEHDMAELRARGSSLQQEFVRAVGAEPDDLELPAWLCGENR